MDWRQLHKHVLHMPSIRFETFMNSQYIYWITCNSGFQRFNYTESYPMFQHILHLQGKCRRRRSGPTYGSCSERKRRGTLTPTVKPMYQSTTSFHHIHPEICDCNMHQNNERGSAYNVDKFWRMKFHFRNMLSKPKDNNSVDCVLLPSKPYECFHSAECHRNRVLVYAFLEYSP
jgi:hypothetical protein